MRAKILISVLLLPLLAFLPGCPAKVTGTSSRQLNEDCDNEHQCMEGLYCEDGKCRALCQDDEDCGNGKKCLNNRCVTSVKPTDKPSDNTDDPGDNTDKPSDNTDKPSDNTDVPPDSNSDSNSDANTDNGNNNPDDPVKALPPQGYGLAPVAGKTSGDRFKIRVIGGSLTGAAKNDVQQVIVNDGAWNKQN